MDRIVECVPNFSTADDKIIAEITAAIKMVHDVKLLNVEPDADYNRTVVTFVGTPEQVGTAALKAIGVASELIDMTNHKGEHPRLGATDVCPFIPVKDVSFDECVAIARSVAERVARDYGVPTYLYGKAASSEQRLKLSDIRKGEYEGLEEKLKLEEWRPDFGDPVFNARSGATVIGVRGFLIAYNVNIESEDVSIAREIGGLVRESGRWVEKDGERVRVPGMLKGIQGMGVSMEKDGRKLTQVSMNVVDYQQYSKPHHAFEEVRKLAESMGTRVTGSEVVGLIPLEAILESGKFFAPEVEDNNELIKVAMDKLGLSDLDPFVPRKKIIELMIGDSLLDLSVDEFLEELASSKPAPGGGSVAALAGSLATSLGIMVANLTVGKEKYADVEELMVETRGQLKSRLDTIKNMVDEDTDAFSAVMAAYGSPRDDGRGERIQQAMIHAAQVPLNTALQTSEVLDLLVGLAEKGNSNAITDVGVAALMCVSAIKGALFNVRINLMSIKDEEIKAELGKQVGELLQELEVKRDRVLDFVEKEFND